MKSYGRSHLSDRSLTESLHSSTARGREATADQLADIGEFEARKLHRPAGYPSTHAYCVHELHLCEQAAFKRIYVARKGRRFPVIFHMIADGRLHLTGVLMMGRHLREDTAAELLAAIEHKTCDEIAQIRAERFPQPDLPTVMEPVVAPPLPPAMPATLSPQETGLSARNVQVETPVFVALPLATTPPRVTPLAPERFALQVTIGKETHDLLRCAQDLLGHRVPPGDVEAVLTFALRGLVQRLQQQKFSATEHPRPGRQRSEDSRHVPAEVQRAVWERDGGQCAFVSDSGHRCTERMGLEFDHIDPYARDGMSTVSNVRLLCRAHNQYEAERTYGAGFMRHKPLAAAEARAANRAPYGTPARSSA